MKIQTILKSGETNMKFEYTNERTEIKNMEKEKKKISLRKSTFNEDTLNRDDLKTELQQTFEQKSQTIQRKFSEGKNFQSQ